MGKFIVKSLECEGWVVTHETMQLALAHMLELSEHGFESEVSEEGYSDEPQHSDNFWPYFTDENIINHCGDLLLQGIRCGSMTPEAESLYDLAATEFEVCQDQSTETWYALLRQVVKTNKAQEEQAAPYL